MPIGTLTAIGGLILQGYGLYKQEEENKKARRESRSMRAEDIAREEKYAARDYSLTLKKMREDRRERAKAWKWREEERGYERAMNFVDRFTGLMDRQPQFAKNLTQVWSR